MSDRQQERRFGRVFQPDPDHVPGTRPTLSGPFPGRVFHPDPCPPRIPGRPRDYPFTYVPPDHVERGPALPTRRNPNDVCLRPFQDDD